MIRLAAIGLGGRLVHMIAGMCRDFGEVKLVAVADPNQDAARQRMKRLEMPDDNVRFFDDADRLLEQADGFDGVAIGTRCHLHTPLAVKVAATGLPLFLEKPVAITPEQLAELRTAFRGKEDRVVVSFPLRVTPLYRTAEQIVRSGRLGTINQVQAFNNVTYGGVYFGDWYRNWDEVGGLWLQKATHDFDYLTHLLHRRPTMIAAMSTQRIYGGNKPHDLMCSQCDERPTCAESPEAHKARGHTGGMPADDHPCAFSRDIRNQDAGSAIIRYADQTIVSYDQDFIVRREAGARGCRIIGYDATLHFDWATDVITVVDHHRPRTDRIESKGVGGHGGGDWVLQKAFLDLIRGETPSAEAGNLHDGMLSVAMCLAARRSCAADTFEQIPDMHPAYAAAPVEEPALVEVDA